MLRIKGKVKLKEVDREMILRIRRKVDFQFRLDIVKEYKITNLISLKATIRN